MTGSTGSLRPDRGSYRGQEECAMPIIGLLISRGEIERSASS